MWEAAQDVPRVFNGQQDMRGGEFTSPALHAVDTIEDSDTDQR